MSKIPSTRIKPKVYAGQVQLTGIAWANKDEWRDPKAKYLCDGIFYKMIKEKVIILHGCWVTGSVKNILFDKCDRCNQTFPSASQLRTMARMKEFTTPTKDDSFADVFGDNIPSALGSFGRKSP